MRDEKETFREFCAVALDGITRNRGLIGCVTGYLIGFWVAYFRYA